MKKVAKAEKAEATRKSGLDGPISVAPKARRTGLSAHIGETKVHLPATSVHEERTVEAATTHPAAAMTARLDAATGIPVATTDRLPDDPMATAHPAIDRRVAADIAAAVAEGRAVADPAAGDHGAADRLEDRAAMAADREVRDAHRDDHLAVDGLAAAEIVLREREETNNKFRNSRLNNGSKESSV